MMFTASILSRVVKLANINNVRMSCTVFDGREASKAMLDSLKLKVEEWVSVGNRPPRLAVVLVGDYPASLSYIRIKSRAAKEVGIQSNVIQLKTETKQNELINVIEVLNKDRNVDGILVQLPLPSHLDQYIINNSINPTKDVDGFTEINMGRLCMNSALFIPCTAMAVCKIIEETGLDTQGRHALVCGRSKHVGLPIVLMLHSSRFVEGIKGLNMTTTLCHRHTPKEQLKNIAQNADFIISATGLPKLFTSDMVKEGAVVIDVGMSRKCEDGKVTFTGDVDFEDVKNKARFITPVPGGVGPMTVSFLMENTLKAAKLNSESIN